MKKDIIYIYPFEADLSIIGGKYKVLILFHLRTATLRYSEIQKRFRSLLQKMLTQQLRELKADNLITRTFYTVVQPKTEYSLNELGKTLIPILENICNWSNEHIWDNQNHCIK